MKKIAADYIFTGNNGFIKNGVLCLENDGTIVSVLTQNEVEDKNELLFYEGIICPGFINTHCHLELSYLHNKIQQHTTLPNFIKNIVEIRNTFSEHERFNAIEIAEQQMITEGIVAVADIANDNSTFLQKSKNNIFYHTFLEVFQLDPTKALATLQAAKEICENYPISKQISITPHAPYSVSEKLMRLIVEENNTLISIHNQETASENTLFKEKNGALYEQLFVFNPTIKNWKATNKSALQSYLPYLKNTKNLLLVHNTYTSKQDIDFANAHIKNVFWCFCPNANLYIENQLPNFLLFENENCTIGTDSLASNTTLSILAELKTIAAHCPAISLEKMLTWATLNGAKFLKIAHQFGTFETGKKPGVNLIQNIDLEDLKLKTNSIVQKLF